MNDSADIKEAADRLQSALGKLGGSIDSLLNKVSRLEAIKKESDSMSADRAALAAKLDTSYAKEKDFLAREKEFGALAEETTQELDRVIKQVRMALGED